VTRTPRTEAARDGAGIGHVLAGIAATIDAGQHQVGLVLDQDLLDR
jgi:hypothetical protein